MTWRSFVKPKFHLARHVTTRHDTCILTQETVVTRRIALTLILYFCSFILEIGEKSSLTGGFKYDFMMTVNSGFLLARPVGLR